MEQDKADATEAVAGFSHALNSFEATLRPVLSAIDALRASGNDELSPLSRARLHITLCYSVNSLFCMYLRTQGIEPSSHPVMAEIERAQDAFMRLRKVEAGLSTAHQPMPDRDRRKHIQNVERNAAKLSALVFPEEADLVASLKRLDKNKRKRRTDSDDASSDDEKVPLKFTADGITVDRDEERENYKAAKKKMKKEIKKERKEAKRKRMEERSGRSGRYQR